MINLRVFLVPMAFILVMGLCGCAGTAQEDNLADDQFEFVKPTLAETGHITSFVEVDTDECTIYSDLSGVLGTCRIGNTGNTLVAHWQMEQDWLLDGVRLYAGAQPPPAGIEFAPPVIVTMTDAPSIQQLDTLQAGPVEQISRLEPVGDIEFDEITIHSGSPISNLCELPYCNDDIEPTADLRMTFSLDGRDIGSKLYIWCEVTASRNGESASALVVDHDMNEVIEQCFRPDLRLPETKVQSATIPGGYFEELDCWASFTITFADLPSGLNVESGVSYPGWCIQMTVGLNRDDPACNMVHLYNSLDPDLPDHLRGTNWAAINYCLNHYQEYTLGTESLKSTIWYFTDGIALKDHYMFKPLVLDAIKNGGSYVPGDGDYVAVIVDRPEDNQDSVILVTVDDIEDPAE